ncbi:universal stress protein [Robiginitalea sp. M366]|uniref:universal stress protein n=1 Tax=Robiginitalea aestuariiviva TaxID=3036903 RepID=UPI00240D8A78|nr:universal stress protein [Robiginitalea aestuariiviva]MDG1571596.1 universal stress protein [Robiginitalea aestuariiviva]
MKNILVPVGNPESAQETLKYAVDFAAAFDAQIYVMEVLSLGSRAGDLKNVKGKIIESSQERLRELISGIDAGGVDLKIATYTGDLIDGLNELERELDIDLIIIAPRSVEIDEELYLGNTSGKIIKRTDIPTLIVPKGVKFTPYASILTAFRSGVLKRKRILKPLLAIQKRFEATVNLLMVKTPNYTDDDLKIDTALMDMASQVTMTEQATTYLGVLEHIQAHQPDLLCVFRRKRGFFSSLWEKNTIRKSEFSVRIPVLVLSVKKY